MFKPSIIKLVLVTLCVVAIAIALASCGGEPTRGSLPAPNPPTPAEDLTSLGRTLLWAGGISTAAALVARVFLGVSTLITEAILASIAVCGFGIACSWVGQHPIVIWGMVAATAVAAVYRYRRGIRQLLVGSVVDSAAAKG